MVKLHIYPFVSCDKYLVHKTENILVTKNGGKIDEPILICGDYKQTKTENILAIKNGGKVDEPMLICGDYKQTLNKVASCYKYPVPKTEGILPAINGVKQLQC